MSTKEYFTTVRTTVSQSPFTRRSFYNLLFLLSLLPNCFPCNAEDSFKSKMFRLVAKGHRLDNALIFEKEVHSVVDCAHLCLSQHPECKSINYEKAGKQHSLKTLKCQLNNETKSTKYQQLVSHFTFNYFEPIELDYSDSLEHNQTKGRSCSDLFQKGTRTDGVYTIDPDGLGAFNVSCDMTTNGGGWTVFQRRMDGSVDFYLRWKDYREGFGNLSGEFWLGLNEINRLSKSVENVLRFDLEDFENETRYAIYSAFTVANETDKYRLTVGNYSGDAGDSFTRQNGMMFTTRDRDNDIKSTTNCAWSFKGAWWYENCHNSNLNARYLRGYHSSYSDGVNWDHWKGEKYSLKKTEMKIRPRSF